MRHEFPYAFQVARANACGAPLLGGLPLDIAFLRPVGVPLADLWHAAREARRLDLSAASVLLANGTVSATFYYNSLAKHLGVGFVGGPMRLALDDEPAAAIRKGFARCATPPAAWVLAPIGDAIIVLVRARAYGLALPSIVLTTPTHLSALVLRQAGVAIARDASVALLERDADLSAKPVTEALRRWPTGGIVLSLLAVAWGAPLAASTAIGLLFLAAIGFRLLVCANALNPPSARPALIRDEDLPSYSILVPLYDEAEIIPSLIGNLDRLDYPHAKLQILILIEADDLASRHALARERLAPHYEIVVVADGRPRTKPRALNVGLALARGHYVTVFDAEDAPAPDQLRMAAAAFRRGPPKLACLQAKLAIDNADEGLLARLFAIEYAGLFDVYNVGLATSELPMALGGTSNHFKADVLRQVGGWDAWNVAEDADLGFRLARFGYRVGMIPSTTRERALTDLSGWFKQRRRWTKGWMQTILVLAHRPGRTMRELGPRQAGILLLIATNLVLGPLLSPVLIPAMLWDVFVQGLPNPLTAFRLAVDTLWIVVLIMGLGEPLFCGYAGMRARDLAGCLFVLPLIIPYQAMISAAAWMGAWDLIRAPFHWHKTAHVAKAMRPDRKKAPGEALFNPLLFFGRQPLRALRAAYFASRAALRAASSATTRDARAKKAAASAAFASSAAIRSASR